MKNLLFKEFKLSVHPTCFLFLPLAAMLIIPSYPYYVAFFYQTLGIFFIFQDGNATNDISFTTLLPVRKRDAVNARFFTVVLLEMLQIIVSIPFAVLRCSLIPQENLAGMEANAALFGLALIMFGIFNIIFLPGFYKTAYKTGTPYLLSCTAMTIFAIIAEVIIQLTPGVKTALDTVNPAYVPQQLAVLGIGVIVFAVLTLIARKMSIKRFEELDL